MGRRARRIVRRARRSVRRVIRRSRRYVRRGLELGKDVGTGRIAEDGFRGIRDAVIPQPPDMGGISEAIDRQTDLTQKEIQAGREQEARATEQNKKNLFNIYQEQTGTNLNFLEGETLEGSNNLEFQGGQFGSMPGQKKKRKKGITW